MKVDIHQGSLINITQDGILLLRCKQANKWRVITDVYQSEKLIFRTGLQEWFNNVRIYYQDLPDMIEVGRQNGMTTLYYREHLLQIKFRFRKPHIVLYKDGDQIAWFNFKKGIYFAERFLYGEIDSDDEETRLYCLLLFIMRLPKLG